MPKFDQTGPYGQGPMTGRGFGDCQGGNRRRIGFRRVGRSSCCMNHRPCFSWMYNLCTACFQSQPSEDKLKILEGHKNNLHDELAAIEKEIKKSKGDD